MRINGVDISKYDARQFTVELGHMELRNETEFLKGAIMPLFRLPEFGIKPITVTLSVHGENSRQKIMENCSAIIGMCSGIVDLELDGFEHKFKCTLNSVSENERTLHKWHLLTLDFVGYEYGRKIEEIKESSDGIVKVTFDLPGAACSPIDFEITASEPIQILRIKNPSDEKTITVKSLSASDVLSINGSTGLFLKNGNIYDIDIWKIPCVRAGSTLEITSERGERYTVSYAVTPIYL